MQNDSRRKALKSMAGFSASAVAPSFYVKNAWADDFRNDPGKSATVKFGFTVPQTGAYADEGADELRAYELAVKHINGEGDGATGVIHPWHDKTAGGQQTVVLHAAYLFDPVTLSGAGESFHD